MRSLEPDRSSSDDGISLLEIINVGLRRRRTILVSSAACGLVGLAIALTSSLTYTATATFLPHGGDQGGFSGISGLAQQFGLSLSSDAAERSAEFYQELLRSREILDGVVESGVEVVTPTGTTTVDLVEHFAIEAETADERFAATRIRLGRLVVVGVRPTTGVVTVSAQTEDPELSAGIVRKLLSLMAEFDADTRQSQASAERAFAEERLGQLRAELAVSEDALKAFLEENRQFSNSPELSFEHDRQQRRVAMRQELVTALAQAYEQARIDEVRNTPVVTVIDHPSAPALPDPRSRRVTVVLGLVVGLLMGFGLAFIAEFGERAKSDHRSFDVFQELLREARGDPFGLRGSTRLGSSRTEGDAET